jgi:TolB-like protein/DNA-binding winged helix-turn-helix (wHTH) protein/Tfp pilus assembly protein PilF
MSRGEIVPSDMNAALPRFLRFGSFEVDRLAGEIRKDGRRIRLQEKPFQLLVLLLDHAGDVVTREQMREALWAADTFVDFDHSLGTAIAKLRVALGDTARNPRFIETVASRGYRFMAPVTPIAAERKSIADQVASIPTSEVVPRSNRVRVIAASVLIGLLIGGAGLMGGLSFDIGGMRAWLRRESNPSVHALAVLPLENLSGDSSLEYFADGMTEQLIAALARLPSVRVISRTSAMQYKMTRKPAAEIGRELQVDALVEGSVAYSGGRARISVQLVDARTDRHLWVQSYERDAGDTLTVQNEITRAIADEIRVHVADPQDAALGRTRQLVPAAQEAYLRGRYHLNKGDEAEIRRSLQDFGEAIARDPTDARAYAGRAAAFIALADFYDRPADVMPRAKADAEQALALDSSLSEAHASLGAVRFLYEWDWRGAEAELKRAADTPAASTDAGVWYAVFLAQMRRFPEATAELAKARRLDPLSVPLHVSAGWVYYLARENARALEEWQQALDLEPNLGIAHTSMWLPYVQPDAASKVPPAAGSREHDTSPLDLATIAGAYAANGRRAEAQSVLGTLEQISKTRYVCPYELATAHAALGDTESALHWLRKGVDVHSICMPDLNTDPRFDALRGDARFKQLLRDVGFPQ